MRYWLLNVWDSGAHGICVNDIPVIECLALGCTCKRAIMYATKQSLINKRSGYERYY